MDTIAINADEILNEDGQAMKKFKVSDTAKAAMAAGVAGAAVGAAGMSMAGEASNTPDNSQVPSEGKEDVPHESVVTETTTTDDVVAEIDPNDVMLEEPVAESSAETDMLAEVPTQHIEDEEYRPFANNDPIETSEFPEPQSDGILIAENADTDVIAEDPTVDLVCNAIDENNENAEEIACHEDVLYAENDIDYGETDIQSDLMA